MRLWSLRSRREQRIREEAWHDGFHEGMLAAERIRAKADADLMRKAGPQPAEPEPSA